MTFTLPKAPADETKLEEELKELGLEAPRVTPAMLDGAIEKVEYFTIGPTHVMCKLSFFGGRFNTIGHSQPISAENFNAQKAEEISYNSARNEMWPIFGAVLAFELMNHRLPLTEDELKLDPHIQRVITERNQTAGRLKALEPLVVNPERLRAMGIDEEEIGLLTEQAEIMGKYVGILQKRLSRVGL